MVGNDVIDLDDDDAGPRGEAFIRRVCADDERRLVERAADPVRMLWRLWAAKETAYKLLRRLDPRLVFAQRRFVVDPEAAVVRHGGSVIPVAWEERGACLSCVGGSRARWSAVAERLADEDPSRAARRLALRLLAEELGLRGVAIARLPQAGAWDGLGPPVVRRRGTPVDGLALSLSHHGRYAACAVAMT